MTLIAFIMTVIGQGTGIHFLDPVWMKATLDATMINLHLVQSNVGWLALGLFVMLMIVILFRIRIPKVIDIFMTKLSAASTTAWVMSFLEIWWLQSAIKLVSNAGVVTENAWFYLLLLLGFAIGELFIFGGALFAEGSYSEIATEGVGQVVNAGSL